MKRFLVLFSALLLCSGSLYAQGPAAAPEQQDHSVRNTDRDPSARAMRESERLQKELALDARQTKKVYKLYYKHFKNALPQRPGMGAPGGMRRGPGGPGGPGGMSGAPRHMGGPGFSGGGPRRPGSEASAGVRPEERPQRRDAEEMRRETEAWREQLAKKFHKIFTEEQYAAWERMTPEPRPEFPAPNGPAAGKPGLNPEHPDDPAPGKTEHSPKAR